MSVLIEGMDMPDMCGHCRFATAFDCMVSGNFIKEHHKINDDCPLVPVPSHGKLIEAAPIMQYIVDRIIREEFEYDQSIKILAELQYAPNIIPAKPKEE